MSETRPLPSEVFPEVATVEEVAPELTFSERLDMAWDAATFRGSEILDLPPQRWLVQDWLPLDALVAVYSPPGVGKSFYALTLALECASGGWWLGTQLEAAPVLYVAGERATQLRDRAEAWSDGHGTPLPDRFTLLAPRPAPQLTEPVAVSKLCERVRATGSKLVVLDTYAMMTLGLEENSSKDTGPVLENLSKIREATEGGLVLVVHHSGKDSSRGLRGSSAFLGAVDLTISLEGSEGQIRARVEKSNAGSSPMPEWYKLEPLGESAVLTSTGAPSASPGLEAAVLAALGLEPLSLPQLLEALDTEGHKVARSTLQKLALKPLLDRGEIVQEGKARSTRYRLPAS